MATAFAEGADEGRQLAQMVKASIAEAVAPLKAENESLKARVAELEARPAPEIDLKPVEKLIQDEIAKWPEIPEIPQLPELPDFGELIGEAVNEAIAALPPAEPGEPGKSVEPADVQEMVAAEVAKAVQALPKPKDGENGVGMGGALIDREGHLILTLTNGETRDLGKVVGKDGENGAPGFGFDDMDACVLDDDRTIELSFRRGDEEKVFTFKWPTPIDRGPFKIDRELPYEPGDGVTWGGQFYICNEQTNEKPDLSKDGKPWRLAVRKGRDGKGAK